MYYTVLLGVRVAWSLVFCAEFCISLVVFLFLSFAHYIYCLQIYSFWLITLLKSSNFCCITNLNVCFYYMLNLALWHFVLIYQLLIAGNQYCCRSCTVYLLVIERYVSPSYKTLLVALYHSNCRYFVADNSDILWLFILQKKTKYSDKCFWNIFIHFVKK